jgi:hypothetical protein
MVGIDGVWGSLLLSKEHRSFAMLVSRLINHPAVSLADRRWSLARCDAGYSSIDAIRCGSTGRLWRGDFGDANTSFERKAPGESRQLSSVTGSLSPNANVGNKVRSGSTKRYRGRREFTREGRDKMGQWIDDRNDVRIQEKVRLSLYTQVERSGYV